MERVESQAGDFLSHATSPDAGKDFRFDIVLLTPGDVPRLCSVQQVIEFAD